MWGVKTTMVFVVIGAVTPKLEEWLHQIPATTSEIFVQMSAVPGTHNGAFHFLCGSQKF